jgi:predicted nucleotidyltransferase
LLQYSSFFTANQDVRQLRIQRLQVVIAIDFVDFFGIEKAMPVRKLPQRAKEIRIKRPYKMENKAEKFCKFYEKMYFCAMISELQKNIIINTIMPFHPVQIGIFGSTARGENTENSDIDILYQLKDTVGLFNLVRIKDSLEEKLNRKVDLVSEKHVHPKLKSYIMSDLKIIYKNE